MKKVVLLLTAAVMLAAVPLTALPAGAAPKVDRLERFNGKLVVTATYHPKSNRTVCDMRDRRIKKGSSAYHIRHNRWRMKGNYSAEGCLRAWVQQ